MVPFNLVRWFKSLFRSRVKTYVRKPRLRPRLEELETRLAPALYTWSGADEAARGLVFNKWSDPLNWKNDVGPSQAPAGTAIELQFDNTGYSALPNQNDLTGLIVDQLTIAGGSYTIGGTSFELGSPTSNQGTITVNSGLGNQTINNAIQLGGVLASSEFLLVQSGSTLTLNGPISGSTSAVFTQKGPGTVVLNGTNSFSGPFILSNSVGNGVTDLTNASGLGVGSNSATIMPNTQLQLNLLTGSLILNPLIISAAGPNGVDGAIITGPSTTGTITLDGNITMDQSSTIGVENAAETLDINGVISDANVSGYNFIKEGPGTIFLDPNNPLAASNNFDGGNLYHGNTFVNGGELQIGQPYALGVGGATTTVDSNNLESGTLALNFDAASPPPTPAADLVYAQIQEINFSGASGATSFQLGYNGAQTVSIPYGAAIGLTVEADLDALSTISGIGASVNVVQINSTFYIVFAGSLGGFEIPTVTVNITSAAGTGSATVSATQGNDPSLAGVSSTLGPTFTAPVGFIVPNENLILNGAGLEGLHDNLGFGLSNQPLHAPGVGATVTFTGALSNSFGDNAWEKTVTFWSTPASVGQNQEAGAGEPAVAIGAALDTNLTVDGQIIDNGIGAAGTNYSFSKVGLGRVILTNDNNFTSDVEIEAGALNIRDSHALGNVSGRAAEARWGASLELQADGIPDSSSGSYNLILSATDTIHLNGLGLDGEGALDNLSGVNVVLGNVSLNTTAGTTSIGVAPDPDPTNLQGATWNDLSQLTIEGVISEPARDTTLTKTGYGELVLTNDNPYTGPAFGSGTNETFITQGWITAENDFALGGTYPQEPPIAEPGVVVSAGAALVIKQNSTTNPPTDVTIAYNLNLSGTGMDLPQPLQSLFPYLYESGALENLDGENTVTGAIYLNGPTGIGVEIDGANTTTIPSQLTAPAIILDGSSPGELLKLGSQRLILQGTNTYTGGVDIQDGVLQIQNDYALGTGSATVPLTTTVENGAALEMVPSSPLNDGGTEGGLQVWYDTLVLNGSGNSAFGDAALTVTGDDNLWRGPVILNADIDVTFDVPNSAFFQDNVITMGVPAAGNQLAGGTVTVVPSTAGGSGVNDIQTLQFGAGVNGGTFTLQVQNSETQSLVVNGAGSFGLALTGYSGVETSTLNTAGLNAGAIQSALNVMLQTPGSLGYVNATTYGTATVTGAGPYTVQFGGTLAGTIVPLMIVEDATGTAAVTPSYFTATTQPIQWSASSPVLVYNIQTALNALASTFNVGAFTAATIVNATLTTPVVNLFPNTRLTVTGDISDTTNPADLTVTGTGELALAGTNTYHGTTYVNEGLLTISNPQALGSSNITAAVQTLNLVNPTIGGTNITLSFADGPGGAVYTTPSIPYTGNPINDAALMQSYLNNLKSIGGAGGSVSVTGVSTTQFTITFAGNMVGFSEPNLGVSVTGGGSGSVVTQTAGAGGVVVANGAELQLQGGVDIDGKPLMVQGQGTTLESELQVVSAVGATGNTFTLGYTNPTTQTLSSVVLPIGATAAQVQSALNTLTSIQEGPLGTGGGSVSVVETGEETYSILFGGTFAGVGSGVIVPGQILAVTGTTGTFELTFGSSTTAALAFNVPASGGVGPTGSIQNALNTILASSGSPGYVSAASHGTATVTLNANGTFTVFFGGTLAGVNVPLLVPGSFSGSARATIDAGVTVFTYEQVQGGSANATPTQFFSAGPNPITDGAVNVSGSTLPANLAGPVTSIAVDPNDSNVIYLTSAGGGAWKTIDGGETWSPLFNGISTVQQLTITGTNPNTDTFTLTYTDPTTGATSTTVKLPFNATPEQVEAALDAVVGEGNSVTVSQNDITAGQDEVQELVLNTTDTAWTVGTTQMIFLFDGASTPLSTPFVYSGSPVADAAAIAGLLNALPTVGGVGGNLLVTPDPTPPAGLGQPTDEAFTITFEGTFSNTTEPQIEFLIGDTIIDALIANAPQLNNFPTANNNASFNTLPAIPPPYDIGEGLTAQVVAASGPSFTDTITFAGGGLANQSIALLSATTTGAATVTPSMVQQGIGASAAQFAGSVTFGLSDNILFLGTGCDLNSNNSSYGTGVYMSTDYGTTWNVLTDPSLGVGEAGNPLFGLAVNSIAVDPGNTDDPLPDGMPNFIYVATSDQANGCIPGLGTISPTDHNAGIWRFDFTTDTWLNLTDIVSVARATLLSGQMNPAPPNPPLTPGPDDNYLISFPTSGNWTDVQIVSTPQDVNDQGGSLTEPLSGGTVLYASLGVSNGNTDVWDPANGIYWIPNPSLVSAFNPPTWNLGTAGNNSSPYGAGTVDNRAVSQFPTGAAQPFGLIPPPFGPESEGNIVFSVVPAGGGGGGASLGSANDELWAAVAHSVADALIDEAGEFFFLGNSVDSAQDWSESLFPAGANYLGESGNVASAILATSTDIYLAGTDTITGGTLGSVGSTPDTYILDLNIAAGTITNISNDSFVGGPGNGPGSGVHTIVQSGTNLYFGTDEGIWEYSITTGLWKDINGNLADAEVDFVATDPTDPDLVYGGGVGTGVIEYNGNQNATQIQGAAMPTIATSPEFATLNVGPVAVDPNNSKVIYNMREGGALWVSTDGGSTWTNIYTDSTGFSLPSNGLATPPMVVDDFSRVFVGGSFLEYSTDQGSTPLINLDAPVDPLDNLATVTSIAVADLQGPFEADPAFPTVQDQGAQQPAAKTIAIVDNIGAGEQVFVSKDLGVTWVNRSSNLPAGLITSLTIDPSDRDEMFVTFGGPANDGGVTGEVWETTNAGRSWNVLSTGLPWFDSATGTNTSGMGAVANDLVVDPRNGNLYLGTSQGVYEFVNGLTPTWQPLGAGTMPMVSANSLSLNQSTNILTIGTAGQGIMQFYLDNPSVDDGALVASSGTNIWNGPIVLAGPTTINSTGDQDLQNAVAVTELSLQGPISDSTYASASTGFNTLTKIGTGDVTLAYANTYTGLTLLDQGNMTIQDPQALGGGAIASSQELILDGAIAGSTHFKLSFNGAGPSASIAYTGTSADAASIQTALTGLIAGSATVQVQQITPGDFLIVFGGTLTGTTALVNATITAGLGSPIDAATGTTVVTTGSGLLLDTSLTGEPLYLFGNGAQNQNGHYAGALENAGGNNTYTGQITLENSSTIAVDGTSQLTVTTAAVGTPAITDLGAAGAFGIQKEGTGTLILNTANNYQGGTTVNEGILNVENNNALGLAGTTTTVLDGSQLQLQGYTLQALETAASPVVTSLAYTTDLVVGQAVTGQGIPAGTTIASINSATQITLSQAATASGPIFLMFGNVAVTTQNLVLSGTGVSAAGALENVGGNNTWGAAGLTITLAASPSFVPASAPGSVSIGVDNAGETLTIGSTITQVAAGVTTSPGLGMTSGLTKVGFGKLVLTQSDSYSGTNYVNQGILDVQNANALGLANGNEIQRITTQDPDAVEVPATLTAFSNMVTIPGFPAIGALFVGESVEGTGIPANTTITAIAPTTLTLSNPVTTSATEILAVGDSFTLTFGGSTTNPITFGATAAEVAAALDALPSVGPGGVSVAENDVNSGIPHQFSDTLVNVVAGNTIVWTYGSVSTAPIPYTGVVGSQADALAVQTALNSALFSTIGGLTPFPGSVTVTANYTDTVFTITFGGYLGVGKQGFLLGTVGAGTSVLQPGAAVAIQTPQTGVGYPTLVYTVDFSGAAFAGQPQGMIRTATSVPDMTAVVNEVAAGNAGTDVANNATLQLDGDPNHSGVPTITAPINQILDIAGYGETLLTTSGNITAGTFTLTVGGQPTTPISAALTGSAMANAIQNALDNLSSVGANNASVIASSTDNAYWISFTNVSAPIVYLSSTGVTGGTIAVSTPGALQNVSGNNTWAGAIVLPTSATVTADAIGVNPASQLTVTGSVQDPATAPLPPNSVAPANLVKLGDGTLVLNSDSYAGSNFIDDGVVVANDANSLGNSNSAVQELTISGTAGTFTLGFTGYPIAVTTSPALSVSPMVTAAALQAALNGATMLGNAAAPGGGLGTATVTPLSSGNVFVVTFGGSLAGESVPLLKRLVATGNANVTVTQLLQGDSSSTIVGNVADGSTGNATLELVSSYPASDTGFKPLTINGAGFNGMGALYSAVASSYGPSILVTGLTTNGSNIVTGLGSTSNLFLGDAVAGAGMPPGVTVTAINGPNTITLSQNATATGTAVLTFAAPITLGSTASIGSASGDTFNINVPITDDGNGYGVDIVGPGVVQYNSITATITNGGTYYASTPTVTFSGGGASVQATGVAILGGPYYVGSVTIHGNGGTGYTSAPTVTFSGGGASTQATGVATISGGHVTMITVLTPGVGYISTPTITLTGGGALVPAVATANILPGSVVGINITSPGVGYTSAPTITLTGGGPTTTATAVANFFPTGDYTGLTDVVAGALQLNDGVSGGAVNGNLQVGNNTPVDQVQQFTLAGFNTGTDQFTLTYGATTTGPIAYYGNSVYDALLIQTALNAVLAPIAVTVVSTGANVFQVSFGGSIAGTNPATTLSGTAVSPAAGTVTNNGVTTAGALSQTDAATALLLTNSQINAASTVLVNSDGLFDVNSYSQTIAGLTINSDAATQGTAETDANGAGANGALTVAGPVQINGGNLDTPGTGSTVTVNGATGSLTMVGGAINTSGANSDVNVTGNVNVSGGALIDVSGVSSKFIDDGTMIVSGSTINVANGAAQLDVTGSLALTASSALNLSAAGSDASIIGPFSVTDSTVTESGANSLATVNGLFTLIGGEVNLSGPGSDLILDANVAGGSDATGSAEIIGIGTVQLNDAATPLFTVTHTAPQTTDLYISADITGSQGLTKAGAGQLELAGVDNYGTTTINAGNVQVDQLGMQTLTLNGFNAGDHFNLTYTNGNLIKQTIAPITYMGDPTGAGTAANILAALQNVMTFLGLPLGDVAVASTGTANVFTITFAAAAAVDLVPMTGAPVSPAVGTVNAVNVNNTQNVTLNGGTLSGTGTVAAINGPAGTPSNGNLVDPGYNLSATDTGILQANGNVSWGSGTTFFVDLDNLHSQHPNPTAGVDYDQLNVNGNVTLGGALLSGSVTTNVLVGDTYTILTVTAGNTITGTFSGLVNGVATTIPTTNGFVFFGNEKFAVTYNSTSVVLTRVLKNVTVTISPAPVTATITKMTEASNSVTATLSAPDYLAPGDSITIGGANVAGYNGTFTVASIIDGSHFTFTDGTSGLTNATTGTLTSFLNPSIYGQDVPYIATVTAEPGAGNLPAGSQLILTFDKATSGQTQSYNIPANVSTYTTAPFFDPEFAYSDIYTPGSANTIDAAFSDVAVPPTFNNNTATQLVQQVDQNSTSIALASTPAISATTPIYGQAVTITATITPFTPLNLSGAFTPTGTATFTLDGTTNVTLPITNAFNMSATPMVAWTIPANLLSVGVTHTVTVSYNGDTYYTASAVPTSFSFQVQKNSTTVSVTASPSSGSTFGQPATFTATVSPNAPGLNGTPPSGTVSFYDGAVAPSNLIGTGTLVNGSAAVTTSTLSVFTHTINAIYNGDGNYTGNSGSLLYVVSAAPTQVAFVSENPDPTTYGVSVVLTANVTPNPTINTTLGLPTPTGLINFWANSVGAPGIFLGSGTVNSSGNASVTTPATALTQGLQHSLFAVYAGDSNYVTSTGTVANFPVYPGVTTTTVTASPVVGSVYGQAITLTAAVTFIAGVPTTGSVSFSATNTITSAMISLGSANVNSQGKAVLTPALSLPAATYSISATYTDTVPDTNFGTSTGGIGAYTVSQANTTTTVTANPSSNDVFGQSVTFTATIAAVGPGAGIPADGTTVTFKDGTTILGTGTTSGGKATFTIANLPVGFHNIVATFPGDPNFNASQGTLNSYQVADANTTTTLTASPASGDVVGESVTFTATVAPIAPGTGLPTDGDVVTFKDGLNVIGTGTTAGGVATLTLSNLTVGAHTITAVFPGDGNYGASVGTLSNFTIGKSSTVTTVTASPVTDVFGEQASFTATVSAQAPGSGTPNNGDLITFKDGGTVIGTATLTSGQAVISLSTLAVGNHSISASFAGDPNYIASVGNLNNLATNNYVVAPAPTSTTLTVAPTTGDVYGEPVTLTAKVAVVAPGVGSPANGDPVQFLDNGILIATGQIQAGSVSVTISNLNAGLHSLTATYLGDANFATSTGALNNNPTNNYTILQAGTTTALSSSPSSNDTYGQTVSFTATVSVVYPGVGTPANGDIVTFMDGATPIGTGTLASGMATFTTNSLIAGVHTITANFGGDNNFAVSTGYLNGVVGNNFTVNQASTTTSVTSTPIGASVSGQPVTFTAAISAIAPGAGVPATGDIVTFKDGTTTLGTGNVSGGIATFTTSSLGVGVHSISASFGGDGNFAASAAGLNGSPFNNFTVAQANTTTTVTASPASGDVFGQAVTFSATIAPVSPGAGTPTNGDIIAFKDGGVQIGTGLLSGGVATFTTSSLIVGFHTISATFAGDANFIGSSGNLNNISVNNYTVGTSPTKTTVTASPPSGDVFGQLATFTASVAAVAPGAGMPANGDFVVFKDGSTTLGDGTLSGGIATFATNSLAVGSHTITAVFGGDTSFAGSTGNLGGIPSNNYIVGQASTTTNVTATPITTIFGQSVTFSATVSVTSPGAGTPANGDTVTFLDGGTAIGTGSISGGVATFSTSALQVGIHSITARFTGDTNFLSSTGGINGVSVNNYTVTQPLTTTTVTSNPGNTVYGESVTFTAVVAVIAPGVGTPANGDMITFLDGGTPIGTGTLSSGLATFTTTTLAAGPHTISASFPGDANFSPSSGNLDLIASNNFVVAKSGSSTSVTASSSSTVFGGSVTFTATVSAVAPGAGTPADGTTVTFMDGATPLGTGALVGGVATYNTSGLAVGSHNITASFPGDPNFLSSQGTLNSFTVTQATSSVSVSASPASGDVFGRPVGVTATITSPTTAVSGGTVDFYLGSVSAANLLNATPAPVIGGAASITTVNTALPVSNGNQIIAVFTGPSNIAGSQNSLSNYAVGQAGTTTVVTSSLPISGFGQTVTFTAAVVANSPSTATVNGGIVTFEDNGTPIGTSGTVTNGVATFQTTALAQLPATHSITAVYNVAGTGSFATSTSAAIPQSVLAVSTTTVTSSTATPTTYGQAIAFTVAVTGSSGTPTGTINLYNGAAVPANLLLANLSLNGSGQVTGTLPTLATGAYTITAVYSGEANVYAPSTGTMSRTVNASPTTTALVVAPASGATTPVYGQTVSLTATVSAATGGNPTTGSVTFTDTTTNTTLGTVTLSGTNTVSITTAALGAATHTITASYSGITNDAASTGTVSNYTVHQAGTTTALFSSAPNAVYGEPVTFSATVSANGPSTVNPTSGSVTFKDGTSVIAVVNLSGSNVAVFTTSALAVATHNITATYSANTNYAASTSMAVTEVVGKTGSSTTVTSSRPTGSQYGQAVTFTADILLAGGSIANPTGTVKFMDGASTLATITLSGSSNIVTYTTSALAVNPSHSISAVFTSSTTSIISSTGSLSPYSVTPAITATTLTSSPANWTVGSAISFTALVGNGGVAISTGTVTFVDTTTGATLGTAKVANGKAALNYAGFTAAGTHSVVANYNGTANYGPSSSAALTQNIVKISLASGTNPAGVNSPVTFTVGVAGAGGTPTGSVSFYDGTTLLGTATLGANGTATFTWSFTTATNHSITAVYSGDSTYSPGTSKALVEEIENRIGGRLV